MENLEKIIADQQVAIKELQSKLNQLTRRVSNATAENIASSSKRIPISGNTYYIDYTGDAYFRNVFVTNPIIASPGYIPPYAAAPVAIATYHQMWYDTVNDCYKITASIGSGGATKQVLITDPE